MKKLEWISVKKRKPKKNQLVIAAIFGSDLIIQKDGETLAQAIQRLRKTCRRVTLAYIDNDGLWNDYEGMPEIVSPSYWMPIPEPPKD